MKSSSGFGICASVGETVVIDATEDCLLLQGKYSGQNPLIWHTYPAWLVQALIKIRYFPMSSIYSTEQTKKTGDKRRDTPRISDSKYWANSMSSFASNPSVAHNSYIHPNKRRKTTEMANIDLGFKNEISSYSFAKLFDNCCQNTYRYQFSFCDVIIVLIRFLKLYHLPTEKTKPTLYYHRSTLYISDNWPI